MALVQQVHKHQTIALSMIVKDEEEVILRALNSVRHIVDYYCICDTGSSDNTVKIIRDYLKENNFEGKVYKRNWVDFAHNRTEAIERASGKCDYIMTLDADEVLAVYGGIEPDLKKRVVALPKLEGDRVNVETYRPGITYQRTQFLKEAAGPWSWTSPVHEVPVSSNEKTVEVLRGICIIPNTDGARAKDKNRFLWDAFIFEKEVIEQPEHWRAWFYMGQSYQDAGRLDLALKAYLHCARFTNWDEESAVSYLRVARITELQKDFDAALPYYWKSYNASPNRAEAIYEIVRYYRKNGLFAVGAKLTPLLLDAGSPKDELLFVETGIYHWRAKDEASVCYYWTQQFEKAVKYAKEALQFPNIPEAERDRIKTNLKHSEDALTKQQQAK